jgi:ssDNA-binding Zn-finger/Zn-ribbon topoisomerase 1
MPSSDWQLEVAAECMGCGHSIRLSKQVAVRLFGPSIAQGCLPSASAIGGARSRLVCSSCRRREPFVVVRRKEPPKTPAVARPEQARRCMRCGCEIPRARLEALPEATECVDCAEDRERTRSVGEVLGRCPLCGEQLVRRYRRPGGPGRSFVGCSGFPNCRYSSD